RDDHGLARLGLADVEEPEVRRHARHAERAEVAFQRRELRVHLANALSVRDGVLLDAEVARDLFALLECGVLRGRDAAGPARAHHLVDRDRADIGLALVHPSTHRRVERDVRDLHEELAILQLGHRLVDEFPVAVLRHSGGARGEARLAVHRGHGLALFTRAASTRTIRSSAIALRANGFSVIGRTGENTTSLPSLPGRARRSVMRGGFTITLESTFMMSESAMRSSRR